jgi:ABC-type transporter MlaC component/cell division protein FtsN
VTLRRFFVAVALLTLGATPVVAGEPTDRLRTFFEGANQVILAPESDGGDFEERLSTVRGLVNELIDFEGAAALALGRHWETLSPPARTSFTRLYADVVERAYLSWVGSKARVGEGGVSIRWIDESVQGDAAVVTSELLARTGGEMPIEYLMVRRAAGWLVRDVVVEGVSLAANYHVQFERVMQLSSYEELLERLREKASPAARAQASVAAPPSLGRPPAVSVPTIAPASTITRRTAATAAPARVVVAELREAPAAVATDVSSVAIARPAPSPRVDTIAVPAVATPPVVRTAPVTAAPVQPSARAIVAAAQRREFWVQVGAFRTADAATRLVQRLRHHAVTIATGGDRIAPVLRVLVGPFAERTAAAAAARSLQAGGIAAFVPDTAE